MTQPLYPGADVRLLGNRSVGDPFPQYSLKSWVENVLVTMTPAAQWGALPDR